MEERDTSEGTHGAAYPVLPLRNGVLFPMQIMPLSVGRASSINAVRAAVESEDKALVVVLQRQPQIETPGLDDCYEVGTLAVLKQLTESKDLIHVIVQGNARVRITQRAPEERYLRAETARLPEPSDTSTEVEALFAEVVTLANRAFEILQPQTEISLAQITQRHTNPTQFVYLLGSIFSLGAEEEQTLLETDSRLNALKIMHKFLTHEVQVLELRRQIASKARTEMSRQEREYMLRQQLHAIRSELGEEEPGEAEAAELRLRANEAELPDRVRKEVDRELARLARMSPAAPDYQVARTYLDLLLELPWRKATEDQLDLRHAREVLDEDHFGLRDVKDRILEHLAVMQKNPAAKAPILCFVGPPGVGKTSLGQSIARALGRKFERISLGGVHDEAELRGHRRTYVGAMPGRIIHAIHRVGVSNPLLMLDEVDKLGADFRGDPASALMEVLDPAQNVAFHDNYVDLSFDLSKVFFIGTANTLDRIPRPLLDRLEVLRLPGYSDEEKREIARRYLIPRQVCEAGLGDEQLVVPDETTDAIIRRYTREAGVRELERMIGRVCRKTTRFIVEEESPIGAARGGGEGAAAAATEPRVIRPADLSSLLGPERFFPEKARRTLPAGVAAGLAWTEAGGEVLYIESVWMPGARALAITGHLGKIMRESARAARSYIRSRADALGLDAAEIAGAGVHIHIPAGAVPKDGPSAGVAIAAALASLYAGAPVRSDTAMTGEITLSGLVLPVGGVREKVLAAHRASIHRVILPAENEKDLAELSDQVRAEMEVVFVDQIEQALEAAVPGLPIGRVAADARQLAASGVNSAT